VLIRLIAKYLKPYWRPSLWVLILTLVQTFGSLWLPSLTADIFNEGVAKGDSAKVWEFGSKMIWLSIGMGIVAVVTTYFASRVATSFGRDLRGDIFKKVMSFSSAELDSFGTASLITRNTNDVQQVQMLMTVGLTVLLSAPITLIGGVIMAVRHNAQLSLLTVVAIPLMLLVIGITMSIAIPQFRIVQKRIDRINAVFREQITGLRVIRAFVRENVEAERFDKANADLRDTQLRINRVMTIGFPTLGFILNMSTVGVIWFGAHLIADDKMQIGDLTAFISYLMQILISVMMATMTMIMVPRAAASGERIKAVLDVNPAISDPAVAQHVEATGSVEFKNVSFNYPGAELSVLHGISFKTTPGTTTAIVGSTGCGKTTLVNLMVRFFDVSSGQVLVNGIDVHMQSLNDLWDHVGLVPQRAYLFKGTVRDNVRFGAQNASDDEVIAALKIAQAWDFVQELDGVLDAVIEQGGSNLSGGQRQRLAIARAVAKRPAIYIFDDSFSALDATTDARLRSALAKETSRASRIVVAQRISTVLQAEQIIVLDQGSIAGIGTHDHLLNTCEAYREIVGSQLEVN
jgi:ATP-binding cassette subfamily B protein